MFTSFLLGISQGLTEFLPISSSAHVLLMQKLTDYSNPGFLEAINLGTFLAVFIYFFKDLWAILLSLFKKDKDPENIINKRLFLKVIIATLPVLGIGILMEVINYDLESWRYALLLAGIASIIFSLIFHFIVKNSKNYKNSEISYLQSFLIGLVQPIAALIPGASRSGVTVSTALGLKIERNAATRFAFLISIPATGAGAIKGIFFNENFNFNTDFIIASIAAFISGLIVIKIFIELIKKLNVSWILYYRIIFGLICITSFFIF